MHRALQQAHPDCSLDEAYVAAVFSTLRDHVHLLPDLVSQSAFFFSSPSLSALSASALASHSLSPASASRHLSALLALFSSSPPVPFDSATVTSALKQLAEERQVESGVLFLLLRLAITGKETGPSLSDVVACMGSERVKQRLQRAAKSVCDLEQQPGQQQQQQHSQA